MVNQLKSIDEVNSSIKFAFSVNSEFNYGHEKN